MQTQHETLSLINGRVHTQSSIASNITLEHGRIVAIDNDVSALEGKITGIFGPAKIVAASTPLAKNANAL